MAGGRTIINILELYGPFREAVKALGNTGAAMTVDLLDGNVFTATQSEAVAWTFSNPTPSGRASSFLLILTNGGAAANTWPTVHWPGGTEPSWTAAGVDIISFLTTDGGATWYGTAVALDIKAP